MENFSMWKIFVMSTARKIFLSLDKIFVDEDRFHHENSEVNTMH